MTAGRAVRCARCGSDWVPVPAPPTALPEAEPLPQVEPPPQAEQPQAAAPPPDDDAPPPLLTVKRSAMARLAAHPALPRSSAALRLAWAGTITLLVLLIIMSVVWRSQIVAAWPPSARAYAAFGLQPQTSLRQ